MMNTKVKNPNIKKLKKQIVENSALTLLQGKEIVFYAIESRIF